MSRQILAAVTVIALSLCGCQSGEQEFVGDRLLDICDDAYTICEYSTGCVLDKNHYIEGYFPGFVRIVIPTSRADTTILVRIYFTSTSASGTELMLRLYEPDCMLDATASEVHWEDVDLLDKAGDDRTLMFELAAAQEGEHVLEIYSDAAIEYVLTAEPK